MADESEAHYVAEIDTSSNRRGRVVVITTTQLHSAKPELRLCAGSNLLTACRKFAMVRISDNGPCWK